MNKGRKVFLIRHAKTKFNVNGDLMGGKIDQEILEDSQEIQNLRDRLSQLRDRYEIDPTAVSIISSPLKRCLQTAVIVKEALETNSEIAIDQDIIETNMGEFTGKNVRDLRSKYGNLIDGWMYNPEEFKFPGGESYQDVRKRARRFIDKIVSELEHQCFTVVCSHVDIIKMVICEVKGISFNTRRDFSVPNSSVSILALTPSGDLRVEAINYLAVEPRGM